MTISIIAAMGRNGVIGVGNALPWRLPEDLKRFKARTMGHTLVMGRKTYQSIGRALPGRTIIVVTRNRDWSAEGVKVAHSVDDALAMAGDDEVFIAGGSEIYHQLLERADRMYLTHVDDAPDGDAHFPTLDWSQWKQTASEKGDGFEFVIYERVR